MKHLKVKTAAIAIAGLMLCGSLSYGEEKVNVKLIPSGYAAIDEGLVLRAGNMGLIYNSNPKQLDHVWMQRFYGGAGVKAVFDPMPIEANLGIELKGLNETPPETDKDFGITTLQYYYAYLTRADVVYKMGNKEHPALHIDAGYFPFKYNTDSRNLGEYLFRTGTYPQYILSDFDFPMARIAGIDVGGTCNNVTWDVLFTNNLQYANLGDLNLTGIVSYKPMPLIEVGAGVQFASIISMYHNRTVYKPSPGTGYITGSYYIKDNGDTGSYTFAGTKLMAKIAFDFKTVLPDNIKAMLGNEDLRLYSEAAILGVKDYAGSLDSVNIIDTTTLSGTRNTCPVVSYDDIAKRIPVMIGFNIPTFKLLDVLSLEVEWFGSTYYNDLASSIMKGFPVTAFDGNSNYTNFADSTKDNWKWSLYGKKTLADHFNISCQFASDHFRWDGASYADQSKRMGEALTNLNHWYWVVKLGYSF
jgi:hypothetical protein